MDKQGHDENITSQGFSSIIYGPQTQSNVSSFTVHGGTQPNLQDAIIGVPSFPDHAFIMNLNDDHMSTITAWSLVRNKRKINISNFYANTLNYDDSHNLPTSTTTTTTTMTVTTSTDTTPTTVTTTTSSGATINPAPGGQVVVTQSGNMMTGQTSTGAVTVSSTMTEPSEVTAAGGVTASTDPNTGTVLQR